MAIMNTALLLRERRKAFVVLLLLTITAVLGLAAPRAQAATGARITVLQYNLCGASCDNNDGGTGSGTSIARVVTEAVAEQPDIITLEEVCLTQYSTLRGLLAQNGYTMDGVYASIQDNAGRCGSDEHFGEAVLSRQDIPDSTGREFRPFAQTGGETYSWGGDVEPVHRGLLCANTSFDGGPLKACVAHAYSGEPEQLTEIHDWMADPTAFPVDTPVILGADLNLQPNNAGLAELYDHTPGPNDTTQPVGRFEEGDETNSTYFTDSSTGGVTCPAPGTVRCRNGAPTTPDGRKIDYVFADRAHFTAPSEQGVKYPESDHKLVTAQFTLTPAQYTGTVVGDFNGDGHGDLLARRVGTGDLYLWAGDGSGTSFAAPVLLGDAWDNYTDFAVGDFNGDGKDDLVGRDIATGALMYWAGQGTAGQPGAGDGFVAHIQLTPDWGAYTDTVGGDFNGDGHDDLIARDAATGVLYFWAGTGTTGQGGDSGFRAPVAVAGDWSDYTDFASGDLNGDGKADLIARSRSTDTLYSWTAVAPDSSGTAQFAAANTVGTNWGDFSDFAAGQLNGDGRADLVGRTDDADQLWLWTGDTSPDGFAPRQLLLSGW